MRKLIIAVSFFLLLPFPLLGADDQNNEMEKLKEEIKQLQDRLEHIEENTDVHKTIKKSKKDNNITIDRQSQIELRESFNDMQEAAPRPYDLTLDPSYQGFIPIPHTSMMIKFNAKPRVDNTLDNTYSGDDNRFVTAMIPVSGQLTKGGGVQYNMNAQGSQLSMDVRAPGTTGEPRFYYENDFSGNGPYYMNYKLRHLYGQFMNIVAGQTYTIFEDADAWPDTVDYEGPNAMISARRPLMRYSLLFNENWGLALSIEKPDSQVDTSGDLFASSENHAPEGGFQIKWAKKGRGHVQFSTIFRELGASSSVFGDQRTFGWGLSLSTSLDLFKQDSLQAQAAYGQGIYYFMNDAVTNYDAAYNSSGDLVPLPVLALMAGYTHHWTNKWRSTASFGFVNLENEYYQSWDSYHRTYYASANIVYQLYKRLSIGLEELFGYKQVKGGESGNCFRTQFSIMYSLFK